jgi:GR25 family glycosyltransferase involved in LPS biosynthesis
MDSLQVYYINMEHRADRREALLKELARVGFTEDQITRVYATSYKGCPNSGCMSSHAAALRIAEKHCHDRENENLAQARPYALIIEDDFQFIEDISKIHLDISFFLDHKKNDNWDAILLTTHLAKLANVEHTKSIFSQITYSSNAAAYLIHKDVMIPLARLFEDNLENLYQTNMHWIYQNDQLWCRMMEIGNWYMFNHYLGFQKGDYSDLSGEHKGPIIPKIIG